MATSISDRRTFKDITGHYDFYETPDGERGLEKTYYYTKYAAMGGAIFSFYEMVCVSKPRTIYNVLARVGRFTLPSAGMGFIFGTSLCLLGQLRKKDDWINHTIAGAMAGTAWGMKYGSIRTGHAWAVYLAVFAGYAKFFKMNNYPMYKMRHEDEKKIRVYDFSIKLYEDPGRPNAP